MSTEHIPLANRPETVLGSSVTAQVLAVLAVTFRFYARSKLSHGFGADDVLVVLACLIAGVGTTFVDLQPGTGLGKHSYDLSDEEFERFLAYTYGAICAYAASAAVIKLSILSQYIRLDRRENPTFRYVCMGMMGVTSVWGICFFFSSIFTCWPITSFWKWKEPGRCILFGSRNEKLKMQAYLGQASSNMVLDVIVFLMPLYLLKNMKLTLRSKLGLLCVFVLGGLVVLISILRLATITRNHLGLTRKPEDATYFSPAAIIYSCIEVNIAVISASIPIFWPIIESFATGQIFVTSEVEVRSDLVTNSRPSTPERYDDEQELTASLNWGKRCNVTKISRMPS